MNNNKNLVIVSSTMQAPGANLLLKAAQKHGWNTQIVVVGDSEATRAVQEADRVIFRIGPKSYDWYTGFAETLCGDVRDKLETTLLAFDKREMNKVLEAHALPAPKTWAMTYGDEFKGEPFVIKVPTGNQGKGVELIRSSEDLEKFYLEYPNEIAFVAQEFIEEAGSSDKRIFVVGDKVVASMQRRSVSDDFRANIHLGGEGESYTPTEEEEKIAIETLAAFKLDFGGVDIIDSSRGPLVLEVNPSPGFAISEVTGVDVADAVVTYVIGETND